ncbi:ABC transporter permease [Haloplasma contractile]|uniref:Teichoic acid translocation permease protein TagG n=1 Tax=Haloplasma contractile SSD-17B TaxID=1033810 RepID=F7PVA6_9MOLU|nr:ABC transporter permease [Haloplasma contractile]ERJ12929.1 Teichoic acid translocation permease protein TagG [Haloplasma contractile SSD-17B]
MNNVYQFIKDHIKFMNIILRLAKFDYIVMFRDNELGMIWSFFNPLIQILTYYVVFGTGLRGAYTAEYPYFLWLISGIVPWFFISPTINKGSRSIVSKLKHVAKMNVKISIFPTITIVSNFYGHLMMLLITVIIAFLYGHTPSVMLFYYLFATLVFLIALNSLAASLIALVNDLANLISPILRLNFWFLPIVWNISALDENVRFLLQLNPIFYLVNGYRASIIGEGIPYLIPYYDLYFWSITLFLLYLGCNLLYRYRYVFYENI